jgi:hypothetical protein
VEPEWVVLLCSLAALAFLWLGVQLGRAHAAERLRVAEAERGALLARLGELERQRVGGSRPHPAA